MTPAGAWWKHCELIDNSVTLSLRKAFLFPPDSGLETLSAQLGGAAVVDPLSFPKLFPLQGRCPVPSNPHPATQPTSFDGLIRPPSLVGAAHHNIQSLQQCGWREEIRHTRYSSVQRMVFVITDRALYKPGQVSLGVAGMNSHSWCGGEYLKK